MRHTSTLKAKTKLAGYLLPVELHQRIKMTAASMSVSAGQLVAAGMPLYLNKLDKKASRKQGVSK